MSRLRRVLRCLALTSALYAAAAEAETVDVQLIGPVNLETFACTDVSRSKFFKRTCYDKAKQLMVIQMRDTYRLHCELPTNTYRDFLEAPSMTSFYDTIIRNNGDTGPFDCRSHSRPE